MSDGDKTTIIALMTGIIAGSLLSGAIFSVYNKHANKDKLLTISQTQTQFESKDTYSEKENNNTYIDNTNNDNDVITQYKCTPNNNLNQLINQHQTLLNQEPISIITQHDDIFNLKIKTNKDKLKITEIDKSPLELRKRFNNKGYVFITHNLATINTELNELVELMRKSDLEILNGCKDPSTCSCNFRHKRCRLFMIRKYSDSPELQFFAPSCTGVTNISPSNKDIKNGTPIHEYVQLFQNKFADRVMDLVNYINFIVDSERCSAYVVDITLIADPCGYVGPFYREHKYTHNDILGNIDFDDNSHTLQNDNDNGVKAHEQSKLCSNGKIVVDTRLARDSRCTVKWHQDRFVEARTNKTHAYDFVAMFLLGSSDITPHKLMIGKINNDNDISKMSTEEIQENVVSLADTWIDTDNNSDIGYIIDQKQGYYQKHSDFDYMNANASRNVITIRLKFLN
jgi:hypothetical protein